MIGLLNCLCSDQEVLIIMQPQICQAYILDSTRSKKKDYTLIREQMDEALFHFHTHGGNICRAHKKKRGLPAFRVQETFPCVQQPDHDAFGAPIMDAYYVMYHISAFVRAGSTFDLTREIET